MPRRAIRAWLQFSCAASDDLSRLLGAAARTLIPTLEELVRNHLSPEEQALRANWVGQPKRATGRENAELRKVANAELRKVASALRTLIKSIDEGTSVLEAQLRGPTLRDMMIGGNEWERLVAFRHTATERLQRLESRAANGLPRRGRPIDLNRTWLASDVAVVLRFGGIRLTRSRVGTFAKVLTVVLDDAYGSAPDDLFRLVKTTADRVNRSTLAELRHSIEKSAWIHSNPSFRRHLATVL